MARDLWTPASRRGSRQPGSLGRQGQTQPASLRWQERHQPAPLQPQGRTQPASLPRQVRSQAAPLPRQQRPQPGSRLLQVGCLLGSLLLHLLLIYGWYGQQHEPKQDPPARVHVRLSAGLAAAMAGSTASALQLPTLTGARPATPPQPHKQAVEQPRPHHKPLVAVDTPVKSVKPVKTTPKPKPKQQPTPTKITPVVKQQKTAQEQKREQQKTSERPMARNDVIKPPSMANKNGLKGTQGGSVSHNKTAETGQSQQVGGQDASRAYDLRVRQHLLARQQVPRVLGESRNADVEVEFLIDRQGNVIRQLMGKSSGIRAFDHAARKLVLDAEPYPPPPATMNWQQRHYRIKIHYAAQ